MQWSLSPGLDITLIMRGLLFTYLPPFIWVASPMFPQFPEVPYGSVSVCPTVAVAAQLVLPRGHASTPSHLARPGRGGRRPWRPELPCDQWIIACDVTTTSGSPLSHFLPAVKSNVQSFAGRYGPAPPYPHPPTQNHGSIRAF